MKTSVDRNSLKGRHSRMAAGISLAAPTGVLASPVATKTASVRTDAAVPVWKRPLDLACILVALPGVLVLMGVMAALIKTVSPGPVFFKQERVGHRRQRFLCYKFRTMKPGANTAAHEAHLAGLMKADAPMTKLDAAGDPRLIPGGALLRASGMDELAQIINVWRGEMSLVGPRPCLPYEEQGFCPSQQARFDALPGLTGLWQVSGKNRTTFTEMVTLDTHYVRNQSFWLDVKILASTLAVVMSQVKDARRGRVWRRAA
jgi:lipopolysaccharide/colanic/teichoic acid biosynthesis glycosyltransferase